MVSFNFKNDGIFNPSVGVKQIQMMPVWFIVSQLPELGYGSFLPKLHSLHSVPWNIKISFFFDYAKALR